MSTGGFGRALAGGVLLVLLAAGVGTLAGPPPCDTTKVTTSTGTVIEEKQC